MNDLLCGDQKICNASLRFFVPDSYSDGALFLVNGRGGPLSELYFQIPSFPSFMNASQYNRPSYTGTSYSIIDETLVRPALQYMATGMGILALCCMALVCLLVMGKPNKVGKALYWLMVLGLACEIGLGASSVWLCMYGSISAPQIALAGGRWNSSFSTGWYAASGFRETLTVLALLFAQLVLFIQGRGILVQLKTKRTKILYTALLVWFLLLAFVPIVLRVVILGLYFESLNPNSTLEADNYILELSGIFVGNLLTQIQNIAQRLSLGLWCTLSLIQAVKSQLLGRRRTDNAGVQPWAGRVLHDTPLFIVSSHIIPCKSDNTHPGHVENPLALTSSHSGTLRCLYRGHRRRSVGHGIHSGPDAVDQPTAR